MSDDATNDGNDRPREEGGPPESGNGWTAADETIEATYAPRSAGGGATLDAPGGPGATDASELGATVAGTYDQRGSSVDSVTKVDAPADALLTGRVLDQFRVEKRLGKGGMGEVYLATDTRLRRQVAIKVLPAELTGNRKLLQRFLTEARACAQLNHPNVTAIHALGEQDGVHYIVMELIEGGDLAKRIRSKGAFGVLEATDVLRTCASGIAAAHALGIIHRDIKPSNVMFTRDNVPKVMDFGLARMAEASIQVTAQGTILGTPQYMSPEQCDGSPADARSDVYSLGATYYELLTGGVPFRGDTSLVVMYQHRYSPPPNLAEICPDLPRGIADIVATCLEKDPNDRYQDAGELVRAIDDVLQSDPDISPTRATFADRSVVSRYMDQTEVTRQTAPGSAAVAGRGRLPRPEELPPVPGCRVTHDETSADDLAPLVSRELGQDRLSAIRASVDKFASGQPGLPDDLCARVDGIEVRPEPVITSRLRLSIGILDYKIAPTPWGPNDVLPAGMASFDAGQAGFFPVEQVRQSGGNLFQGVVVDRSNAEEFEPVAALAAEESDEGGLLRPMISRGRRVRVQVVEEISYHGTLGRRFVAGCATGRTLCRRILAFPTVENMKEQFGALADETAARLDVDRSLLDPESLIAEAEPLCARLRDADPPNPPEIDETYGPIVTQSPVSTAGHLSGLRTVRCIEADLTSEIDVVYQVRLTKSGQMFEAYVLPDGSVLAETLARDYMAATARNQVVAAKRAIWKLATTAPETESDWIVLLSFWLAVVVAVAGTVVVISSC